MQDLNTVRLPVNIVLSLYLWLLFTPEVFTLKFVILSIKINRMCNYFGIINDGPNVYNSRNKSHCQSMKAVEKRKINGNKSKILEPSESNADSSRFEDSIVSSHLRSAINYIFSA